MAEIKDPENTLVITLAGGEVVVEMLPDVAPKHVEQIKALARAGEYDNVAFHRVIDGFMAQTGDVAHGDMEDGFNIGRAGTGGSSKPNIPAEFSKLPFDRGVCGMARSQSPNSGEQPVLHHVQGRAFPERPVHGLGPGDLGHGACRRDHPRRAADARRTG